MFASRRHVPHENRNWKEERTVIEGDLEEDNLLKKNELILEDEEDAEESEEGGGAARDDDVIGDNMLSSDDDESDCILRIGQLFLSLADYLHDSSPAKHQPHQLRGDYSNTVRTFTMAPARVICVLCLLSPLLLLNRDLRSWCTFRVFSDIQDSDAVVALSASVANISSSSFRAPSAPSVPSSSIYDAGWREELQGAANSGSMMRGSCQLALSEVAVESSAWVRRVAKNRLHAVKGEESFEEQDDEGKGAKERHSERIVESIEKSELVLWPGKGKVVLTYVYLAGVEGSGHHGFMALLNASEPRASERAASTSAQREGLGGNLILDLADTRPVHAAAHSLWLNDDAERDLVLQRELTAVLTALASAVKSAVAGSETAALSNSQRWMIGPLTADGQPISYPFGADRSTTRRPRLEDIRRACLAASAALSSHGVIVRLRVIGLYRDPMAMTYSRMHQMVNILMSHALLQARIVEENLRAVATDIRSLACGVAATVRYEELLDSRQRVAAAIQTFIGLPRDALLATTAVHSSAIASGSSSPEQTFEYHYGASLTTNRFYPSFRPNGLSMSANAGLRRFFGYDEVNGTDRQGKDTPPPLSDSTVIEKGWYVLIASPLSLRRFYRPNEKDVDDRQRGEAKAPTDAACCCCPV